MSNSKDRKKQTTEYVKKRSGKSLAEKGENVLCKTLLDTLDRNSFQYLIIDNENRIRVPYQKRSSRLWLDILSSNEIMEFRVNFPFKINESAVPLLTLFVTDFNQYLKGEKLNLNLCEGVVGLEYYYGMQEGNQSDEEKFLSSVRQMFEYTSRLYDILQALSELGLKGRVGEYYREQMYSLLMQKKEEVKEQESRITNKDKSVSANEKRMDPHEKFIMGNCIGVSKALAIDQSSGGTTFPIETVLLDEKEGLEITGLVGDMTVESVKIAVTIIKRMFPGLLSGKFIHVHMGEGSIAKEGTSAGVSVLMSILSAAFDIPIYEKEPLDIAFTGELGLNGYIVEVGNVEEKISAAIRSGCRKVFIPEKDIKKMNKEIFQNPDCEVIPMKHVYSVIKHIFPEKLKFWEKEEEKEKGIVNYAEKNA